jgi:hypothetical protein
VAQLFSLGISERFMQEQPAIKRSRLKELIALLVFLFIGGMFAMPVFSTNGEISGRSKMAFLLLAFCRLAWQIYKGKFRFRDYFVYFGLVIGFCIWLDSYIWK